MKISNIYITLTLRMSKMTGLAGLVFVSGMSGVQAQLPVVHPTMPWSNNVQITQQTDNYMQIGQNAGRSGNWILNWQSFDISKDSRVEFVQPSATHIALNRIYQGNASQILGSIDANGRIYLINQNGITFGKNSTINVNSMVASSLALNINNDNDFIEGKKNISNRVRDLQAAFDTDAFKYHFQDGVLKEIVDVVTDPGTQVSLAEYQQQHSQHSGPIILQSGYKTDANGDKVLDQDGNEILVQAQVNAQLGGGILMLAPVIENSGNISANSGQVVLAAAKDKVYLTPSQDPALRGFLVEVKTGGTINNLGSILSKRGNITLAGLSINQNGLLQATSSVNENGSIRLLARDGAKAVLSEQIDGNKDKLILGIDRDAGGKTKLKKFIVSERTGDVTLQSGSTTQVTVDVTDETKITDLQSMQASRVEITGKNILIKSGSNIKAQGGRVVNEDSEGVRILVAGSEVVIHATGNAFFTATTNAGDLRQNDNSKIIIESGSKIDVSGNKDAQIEMQRNELEVTLTGNFLRDAPLQRDAALRNETVTLDVREGTPLGDISDSVASGITRGINELAAEGGRIDVISQGGVLLEESSEFDISGGSISYLDGFVSSSLLLTDTGKVIDIADAAADLKYTSVFGRVVVESDRWGKAGRQQWSIFGGSSNGKKRFYDGYTEGKNAGKLKIKAHVAIVDATLTGGSENGVSQRSISQRANGGELTIELGSENDTQGQSVLFSADNKNNIKTQQAIGDFYRSSNFDAITATTNWQLELNSLLTVDSGISNLSLSTAGDIVVNETANLNLISGGSLSLSAQSVLIDNSIRIVSGDVSVNANNGNLKVNGVIDTSGSWVNDKQYIADRDLTRSVNLNGGNITLKLNGSSGELLLSDSFLKANGGAWLQADGKLKSGDGGSITLAISDNNNNVSNIETGQFEAYSAVRGGKLSIAANRIKIASEFNAEAAIGELQFTPDFFTRGGFSDFELISNADDITVVENTFISPTTLSYVFNSDINIQKSADSLFALTKLKQLESYAAPVTNLSLSANQRGANQTGVGLQLSKSAVINMSAGSALSLSAVNNLILQGDIYTAGGDVDLTLNAAITGYGSNAAIWLDGKINTSGNLNAQGEFVPATFIPDVANDLGLITGRVLDAGDVTVNAKRGYIVTSKNSEINTSGGVYDIDLPARVVDNTVIEYQRQKVSSEAGDINFFAAEGMYLSGNLQAVAAGVDGAAGGKLSVAFDLGNRNTDPLSVTGQAREVHLIQQLADLPSDFFALNIGNDFIGADINDAHIGKAWLSAQTIKDGGFSGLKLQSVNMSQITQAVSNTGALIFDNNIDLQLSKSLELVAPVIGAQADSNSQVNLSAPYVLMGSVSKSQPIENVLASSGNSTLNIAAGLNDNDGLLELTGNFYLQGVDTLNLSSTGDIRLRGVKDTINSTELSGSLNSWGDVNLRSDQLYASTFSQYGVQINGKENAKLTISRNSNGESSGVLSAGSLLELTAPVIQQSGVVKAPQGSINFNASQSLTFGDQSITSVSGENQLIPYGRTLGEERWIYPVSNDNNQLNGIVSAPLKEINLHSDDIKIAETAVFDISGGGDLSSWEFVPGLGGSVDSLLPENANGAFAVIHENPTYAPYDYLNWLGEENITPGEQVYLAATNDLAEGLYTILPARYALLPGAHLITPTGETQLLSQQFNRPDGAPVVAGQYRVAGTDIRDNLWSGFVVESADAVRLRSEYFETTASQFFREDSLRNNTRLPVLPEDAGILSILAVSNLELSGVLQGSSASTKFRLGNNYLDVQGRGSLLNISGESIRIVSEALSGADAEGGIEIVDAQLNRLRADSVLIGGSRVRQADGVDITTLATDITVSENVNLNIPEMIFVAKNNINIKNNAKIVATGTASVIDSQLNLKGDGALLRVSVNEQVGINRIEESVQPLQGVINLGTGVEIEALNSIVLDSSVDVIFQKDAANIKPKALLNVNGGSLTLASSRISIGNFNDPAAIDGVSFTKSELQALNVNNLVLSSRNGIDLYGDIELNLNSIEFETGRINAYLNKAEVFAINARDNIILSNAPDYTSSYISNSASAGNVLNNPSAGQLQLNAGNIKLANGTVNVSGLNDLNLNASDSITMQGKGRFVFNTAGQVVLDGRITTGRNTDYTIDAKLADVLIQRTSTTELQTSNTLGGKLKITANALTHAGQIDMASGYLSLSSVGANADLILADSSVINLSGIERDFAGELIYTPGGSLTLNSDQAGILFNETASIDLSSGRNKNAAAGGDAGSIKFKAAQGIVSLRGNLLAESGNTFRAGSFSSQSLNFENLSAVNQQLNNGFNQRRYIKIGEGDINLAANEVISAQDIFLQTDNGIINILGSVDASATKGGRLHFAAQKNNALQSDVLINLAGVINVNATDVAGEGGDVFIETRGNGLIDISGSINVAGGSESRNGKIIIRTPRVAANDDINLNALAINNISGYRRLDIEGYKRYSVNNVIDITKFNAGGEYADQAVSFMQNAGGIKSRLGLTNQNNLHLRAGVELNSAGDIRLDSDLDLVSLKFSDEAGVLTLRAQGNIDLNANLQDGFVISNYKSNVLHQLQNTESWSYNLVAGAKLDAASISALNSGKNNITLAADKLLRTGTGDISLMASGDLTLSQNSAVYTAGQKGESTGINEMISLRTRRGTSIASFATRLLAPGIEFPEQGGDVSVNVGGDFMADPSASLLVTDWLYRLGPNHTNIPSAGAVPNMIGISFANYKNALGALGGGDINVEVSGNIENINISVPVTEKYIGDVSYSGNRILSNISYAGSETKITGLGDISVVSGGDITRSNFFAANGTIDINANGNIGNAADDSGLYLVIADSKANVFAAGDINLQGVSTPNILPYSALQKQLMGSADIANLSNFYFDYGENSAVELVSLNGTVEIRNEVLNAFSSAEANKTINQSIDLLKIYPANFSAQAIDGSLIIKNDIKLYPSLSGGFSLFAQNDLMAINDDRNISLKMLDILPQDLPSKFKSISRMSNLSDEKNYNPATSLLHLNDPAPSKFIANSGDIFATNEVLTFEINTSEQTQLYAGRDILGMKILIQNNAENNISTMQAGRDIRHINSAQFGLKSTGINKVIINGPGELQVLAGRDINLGNQSGIVATANSTNPLLPAQGSRLLIMAGLGDKGADFNGFIERYFTQDSAYAGLLLNFMKHKNTALESFQQALSEFKQLAEKQQRSFIVSAFSSELTQSATRAAKEQSGAPEVDDGKLLGYSQGLDAIDVLFPGTIEARSDSVAGEVTGGDIIVTGGSRYVIPDVNAAYKGNLSMVASTIQTRGDDADISILAPGGLLNVGLSVSTGSKQVEKGIITRGNGSISLFTQGDIAVNQSRVQALNQGFILGWSTKGNVDAGRGEKTALVIPTPRTVVDQSGAVTQVIDVPLQGNGIRSACSDAECLTAEEFKSAAEKTSDAVYLATLKRPGDVTLAALAGVIDAGDAGIRSGGNLILATDTVLNANQISVGGDSTGVPVDAGALGVDLGGLDVNSVGEDTASELVATDTSEQFGAGSVAILQVEVMGLSGDEDANSDAPSAGTDESGRKDASSEPQKTLHKKSMRKPARQVWNNKKSEEKKPDLSML